MKTSIAFLLLISTAMGTAVDLDKPIPELRLADGRVLRAVEFTGYAQSVATARWGDGRGTIRYDQMPAEIRKAAEARRPKREPDSAEKSNPPKRVLTEKLGSISILEMDLRALESLAGYVRFSWSARVNNSTSEAATVRPKIYLLDEKEFELDQTYGETESLPPGQAKRLSGTGLVSSALWQQTKSYRIRLN